MTSKLTEVLIDCADAEGLASFWCGVLGWKIVDRDDDDGAVEIGDGGDGVTIVFVPDPEPKTIKNRIHFDVVAVDGDQRAEVERVLALGAREIDIGQGDVTWVVLADPEGNEFCILRGSP